MFVSNNSILKFREKGGHLAWSWSQDFERSCSHPGLNFAVFTRFCLGLDGLWIFDQDQSKETEKRVYISPPRPKTCRTLRSLTNTMSKMNAFCWKVVFSHTFCSELTSIMLSKLNLDVAHLCLFHEASFMRLLKKRWQSSKMTKKIIKNIPVENKFCCIILKQSCCFLRY